MKLTTTILTALAVIALSASSCIININDDPAGSCRYTLTTTGNYTNTVCIDKKKSDGCPMLTNSTNEHNVIRSGVSPTEATTNHTESNCSSAGYASTCATANSGYTLNTIYAASPADCAAFID